MSEFAKIESAEELDHLDSNEVVAGYWAGRNGENEPGSDKSRSYWHGWRNGRVDGGHDRIDEAQAALARSFVHKNRVEKEYH